jgi:glutathione peroxidase
MQLKNKKNWVKWTSVIMLLLLLGCSLNIFKTTKNSNTMTTRQKILKAAYPAMMWFTKVTGVNSKSITNKGVTSPESFYNLPATLIDDSAINLNQYKGKKILLVNTASDCGYTGQYEQLEKLYQQHREKLVILGFPANDFKGQEKGTDLAIASFCKLNYGVSFPLFKKSKVIIGTDQNEIFKWLTQKNKNGWNEQAPTWNFCKYLIDEQGRLTHFFASSVEPSSQEVLAAINQ